MPFAATEAWAFVMAGRLVSSGNVEGRLDDKSISVNSSRGCEEARSALFSGELPCALSVRPCPVDADSAAEVALDGHPSAMRKRVIISSAMRVGWRPGGI